jgi:hypothetical protein
MDGIGVVKANGFVVHNIEMSENVESTLFFFLLERPARNGSGEPIQRGTRTGGRNRRIGWPCG